MVDVTSLADRRVFCSKGPSGHVIVEQPNVTHVFLESEVRNRNSGGEQLDVPFRIKNDSRSSVAIRLEHLSCGCFNLLYRGRPFLQGAEVRLPAGEETVFSIPHRSPAGGSKTYTADLSVLSDEQESLPGIRLTYKIQVEPNLVFHPNSILQQFAAEETVKKATVLVKRRTRESAAGPLLVDTVSNFVLPAKITPRSSGAKLLSDGIYEDEWSVEVELEIPPSGDTATFDGALRFTAAPEAAVRSLPILLKRAYGLLAPEVIHFGRLSVGDRRARRIAVTAADGSSFRILHAHCASDAVSVDWADNESRVQILDLALSPSLELDRWEEFLELTTSHSQATLKIPLKAVVRPCLESEWPSDALTPLGNGQ